MDDAALDEFLNFCERVLVNPKGGDVGQVFYFPAMRSSYYRKPNRSHHPGQLLSTFNCKS
jgi:hypothetical protein